MPNYQRQAAVLLNPVGDKAFRELLQNYQPRALGFAMNFANNLNDARELAMAAYLQIFQRLRVERPTTATPLWFYRQLLKTCRYQFGWRNAIRRWWRKRQKQVLPDIAYDENIDDTYTNIVQQKVFSASKRLPFDLRAVFVLRFYEGLMLSEIAKIVGRSEPKVSQQLHEAVQRIRRGIV